MFLTEDIVWHTSRVYPTVAHKICRTQAVDDSLFSVQQRFLMFEEYRLLNVFRFRLLKEVDQQRHR
jgi:hypothetical protein